MCKITELEEKRFKGRIIEINNKVYEACKKFAKKSVDLLPKYSYENVLNGKIYEFVVYKFFRRRGINITPPSFVVYTEKEAAKLLKCNVFLCERDMTIDGCIPVHCKSRQDCSVDFYNFQYTLFNDDFLLSKTCGGLVSFGCVNERRGLIHTIIKTIDLNKFKVDEYCCRPVYNFGEGKHIELAILEIGSDII